MTLILGIDPGSVVTGFGVIRSDGTRHEYLESGCIRTVASNEKSRDVPMDRRLHDIYQGLSQVIETWSPEEVAIEQIFMARSADSALKLGHARGVATVTAANSGVPLFEYEARKIKQATVGTGAAAKHQVEHMVKLILGISGDLQSDAADALAIAVCHANSRLGLQRTTASRFSRGRAQIP